MTDFDAIHGRLRQIMLDAAQGLAIVTDEPGNLIVHETAVDEHTGNPRWFGTVTTKKSYVAYHLIPLYEHPALAAELSGALSKRRQGKTCFNFKKADEALFDELLALSRRARSAID
ncbi:hypothetical protein [Sphingomonas sp. IC4-52]|uniref:hypothetical protein n=1 Tax=Sphingomonas sp. IC4-52 TaxID=2887202 RepID=UPI001D10CD46|nr:hypothetical protein [Sphingomonas sp. IC4-52]MCC2981138.1 hypothetical protein [Sphingomonas sp. IC4-52]